MMYSSSSSSQSSRDCTPSIFDHELSQNANLSEMIEHHIAALRAIADAARRMNKGGVIGSDLITISRKEAATRLAIINYSPTCDEEENDKLTYMAAYIIATGKALTDPEMSSVLDGSRERRTGLSS
ncbi:MULTISPECIES: hypothetical protein [Agrobacterium]|uniref:hypothetical protein n=1 Tax=Agrobacterium TaxID=357 RepID=UPI0009D0C1FE|nr:MULTISPECIES: hypothetical protein [Agrobacterium]QCL77398.1 hypothetical protein CFBP5499_28495 [Agrobacterium tumefaciens]CUX72379.1 conserved hypothetical protein [Agrobacterium sp. NCPPB 925]